MLAGSRHGAEGTGTIGACGGDALPTAYSNITDTQPCLQYTWLTLPGSGESVEFLVGTNVGNVYKVSAQGFEVVHPWRPQTQGSWQPYTMLNVEDRLLTGQ